MNEIDKAYHAGYIAALVMAKAHHMKVVGEWHFCNPDEFVGYVSEAELATLKESAHIPYCSICGKEALFQSLDNDKYIYVLSDYCPNCGSIMNPDIANKSPEDSIKEQTEQYKELYNCILDDLHDSDLGSEVD